MSCAIVALTLAYVLLCLVTKPNAWGDDTGVYAPQIVRHSQGLLKPAHFWDFGHLLWRPTGYLLWQLGKPWWSRRAGFDERQQVFNALQLPNLLSGYMVALASFGIAWRVSRSIIAGALVSAAFLAWNPNLACFQTGMAYIPGLALQLAGFYLLLGNSRSQRSRRRAWIGGTLLALSVCVWLPYLFGIPCVFLLAWLWDRTNPVWKSGESKTRLRWLGQAATVFVLVGLCIYAVGTWQAGIRSPGQFIDWALDAGHGYHQGNRLLRTATGLPRGMLDLGDTGLAFKRYLLHDPYARVGVVDLLRTGLWKMVLFYIGVFSLIWTLMDDRDSRPVLITLLAGGCLGVFFSISLNYAGQQERWMPFFVGLLPATAYVFRSYRTFRLSALPFAILLVTTCVTDFIKYRSVTSPDGKDPRFERLLALEPLLVPNSMIGILSGADEVNTAAGEHPFHRLGRLATKDVYIVTEPSSALSPYWPRRFAGRGLETWLNNGDVWISKRLIAEAPLIAWGWAEGDDPNLVWRNISAYFRACVVDGDEGGADGFVRIERTPENLMRLNGTVQGKYQ